MRSTTTALRRLTVFALCVAILAVAHAVYGQSTLTALTSFGNGDGWRAPLEVIPGDVAGTTDVNGDYTYFNIDNLERGLAYNPVTGNLVMVSRDQAGNGIRILNGTSGADTGALNQGTGIITGGNFATNMVGVADDGATYVGNLQTAADTALFKVYRWADSLPATTPTTFFGSTVSGYTGTPRLGDSLDVFGSGAGTTVVAGVGPNGGPTGYSVITASGATTVTSFSNPGGITGGDFRLGITFAGTVNDVWGKQISQNAEFTTYSGSAGTGIASNLLTAAGEAPMDYAVIGGTPLLATVDTNFNGGTGLDQTVRPIVRVYDVSDPTAPSLLVSAHNIGTEPLPQNINATGSVKWGQISGNTATLYALVSNQGIQAFTFTFDIPEPELDGDFNDDGTVDAADYVVWRKNENTNNTLPNDGGLGTPIDQDHFNLWRANFGESNPGSGGGSVSGAVPEPSTVLLAIVAAAALTNWWRRRR